MILLFTSSDLTSITNHIHNWVFLLWLHLFILSGVIFPFFFSNTLGTYWPGGFIFQCHILLPFHSVHGILKARIPKWFAIPFSNGASFISPQWSTMFVFVFILFLLNRLLWGESKLAKMACLGSLTPCFLNIDCVTVEIIYSTEHACHKVLTWSQIVCRVHICELHLESGGMLLLHQGCDHCVSHEMREYRVSAATAVASPRRA